MKLKVVTLMLLSLFISYIPAWADLSKTEVSQLYVSIFGRASEGEGNTYWKAHADMANAANSMLNTQAAKDYFGANLNTNQAFIEHIYLNTLNKTIADDFDGISYWVDMLDAGTTRGEAVATLVGAINDYAPNGPYYNPDDTATVTAYNQFMNRVEVSNYMADTVYDTPDDWETSTSFSYGMVVTDDPATAYSAMVMVNGFIDGPAPSSSCGAYVAQGVWKEFDCYNLAAIGKTTGDDPFTPSWRLNGGYWQWGRKGPDPSQWYDTNTANFAHGPTGPDEGDANDGEISNWDDDYAPNSAWSDTTKTSNDPCPAGYRVPTESQWSGVVSNNTLSTVGTWSESATNYSSARSFGNNLMLPTVGYRGDVSGSLYRRGNDGSYWSSTQSTSGTAWSLEFYSSTAEPYMLDGSRSYGASVRCVVYEIINVSTYYQDNDGDGYGDLNSPYEATSQPSGYVTNSTDCDDSDADINPGATEVCGDGIDQDCNGSDLVCPGGDCGAYVAPGVWKEFDCYNLAAIGKTTNDDPFTPSWRLNGGYWQWGRRGPNSSQWHNTNTANFVHGPTGPNSSDVNNSNRNSLTEWDKTDAPDDSWSDDFKTAYDPCPPGYRVPTKTQWSGVIQNNTVSGVGTWTQSDTNYSTARFFGNDLMLPAAGLRSSVYGGLGARGSDGMYWSRTSAPGISNKAFSQYFWNSYQSRTGYKYRREALSVRCVVE